MKRERVLRAPLSKCGYANMLKACRQQCIAKLGTSAKIQWAAAYCNHWVLQTVKAPEGHVQLQSVRYPFKFL
jgi:hypothetical protein